jgi:hypothetical protein
MWPGLLILLLVACLLALLPVWRLRVAGWPPRSLFIAWLSYAIGIFVIVRFPGPFRFLLPILVLAMIAPFVAGPERLTRVLRGRRPPDRAIIDVTPRTPPGLPEPPEDPDGGRDGT